MRNEKTVVVLGMHRSGTSMTSGILTILGVNMGKRMIGKNPSNPLGHFENKDFYELNKSILQKAGGDWETPPSRDKIISLNTEFDNEIKNLIKNSNGELWGWKDPRTTLTIELYLPYLSNPHFIICHRNQYDVGNSLYKRGNMSIEEGIVLRNIYEKRLSDFFANNDYPKIDIDYEDVIANPDHNLDNIIEFLHISIDENKREEARNFILTKDELNKLKKREAIKKKIRGAVNKLVKSRF